MSKPGAIPYTEFVKIRDVVAQILAADGRLDRTYYVEVEPSHVVMAENLLNLGIIDIEEVLKK